MAIIFVLKLLNSKINSWFLPGVLHPIIRMQIKQNSDLMLDWKFRKWISYIICCTKYISKKSAPPSCLTVVDSVKKWMVKRMPILAP